MRSRSSAEELAAGTEGELVAVGKEPGIVTPAAAIGLKLGVGEPSLLPEPEKAVTGRLSGT